VIKKDNFNPKWAVYICTKCGCEYQLKYADLTECSKCRSHIHKEIQSKLSGLREFDRKNNLFFSNNWKPKKKKR